MAQGAVSLVVPVPKIWDNLLMSGWWQRCRPPNQHKHLLRRDVGQDAVSPSEDFRKPINAQCVCWILHFAEVRLIRKQNLRWKMSILGILVEIPSCKTPTCTIICVKQSLYTLWRWCRCKASPCKTLYTLFRDPPSAAAMARTLILGFLCVTTSLSYNTVQTALE